MNTGKDEIMKNYDECNTAMHELYGTYLDTHTVPANKVLAPVAKYMNCCEPMERIRLWARVCCKSEEFRTAMRRMVGIKLRRAFGTVV